MVLIFYHIFLLSLFFSSFFSLTDEGGTTGDQIGKRKICRLFLSLFFNGGFVFFPFLFSRAGAPLPVWAGLRPGPGAPSRENKRKKLTFRFTPGFRGGAPRMPSFFLPSVCPIGWTAGPGSRRQEKGGTGMRFQGIIFGRIFFPRATRRQPSERGAQGKIMRPK